MAKLEALEEKAERTESPAAADLLIAVAAPVDMEQLQAAAAKMALRIAAASGSNKSLSTAIAFPAATGVVEHKPDGVTDFGRTGNADEMRLISYPFASVAASVIPWLSLPANYYTIFGLARELRVRACAVVGFDLAVLEGDLMTELVAPLFEQGCDLAMPIYPQGKFEGLLNSSILAPLPRALYGKRIRFPLGPDFAVSAPMLQQLGERSRRPVPPGQYLFWPATEAALCDRKICQVRLNVQHHTSTDGIDLSTVLAQTVGPLFADMEANAAVWQRVHSSQPVPTAGVAAPPANGATADVRQMVETFQLGFRNLQEVWSLVLPPVTLLELKRLTRMSSEKFRMPDELWVRIIYDFSLAYRLRTISRSHLLGALTPLYLGWVASYVLEVGSRQAADVEQRWERLARAYEEGKPYLLSRWRWPDRFNP